MARLNNSRACVRPGVSVLPVLAVDLISSQGVVKHEDLVGVLKSWSGVLAVLQLHSSIQQGEVPPDDQSVRTVCGGNTEDQPLHLYSRLGKPLVSQYLSLSESDLARWVWY